MEYTGEILNEKEAKIRETWSHVDEITYMFNITEDTVIDGARMGNILRFANHSKKYDNAYAKNVFVNGNNRILLYAKNDIQKYEEILFDYDGNDTLSKKFKWINDNDDVKKSNKKNKSTKNKNQYVKNKRKRSNSQSNSTNSLIDKINIKEEIMNRKDNHDNHYDKVDDKDIETSTNFKKIKIKKI